MIVNELLDRPLALTLWDYNHLNQPLRPADFLFVMCSYNLEVADRANILFQQKMGKFIALSGGEAHLTDLLRTDWDEAEAIVFKKRLQSLCVSPSDIVVEDKATNCGENIAFTKEILKDREPAVTTGLIVQKPYMERRALATAEKQWPEIEWQVTSPNTSYEDYIKKHDEEKLIHIIVGDAWRVKEYAKQGFQTEQEMPEEVEDALERLIDRGYTKHISK